MDPVTILALVTSGITDIKLLIPEVQRLVQTGQITPAQQKTVLDALNELNDHIDAHFTGPEWEIKPAA